MNKAAAAQYLTDLFGTRQGYVAVAYKEAGDTKKPWKEDQFEWPKRRNELLQWAADHTKDNVFVCPALRIDPHVRKKGDMQPTQWLWADVDWQTVPKDLVDQVGDRIAEVGSKLVSSGSGDNVHVYVKLSRPVDRHEFAKLNTGLRDYLLADNKQADNSFLRLPGTTNWKTDAGSPVRPAKNTNVTWKPEDLLKKRLFRDTKVAVEADATEWDFVEVQGLSRRMQAQVTMPVQEAEGRYGNRHKAVWAITKDLHTKWGLDNDQIHSLMHKFPAAQSKTSDENGYDVHADVDRCLARIRQVEQVAPDLSDDEQGEVMEALSEPTEDDITEAESAEIQAQADVIRKRNQASKLAKQQEAERAWIQPPPTVSRSLTDALSVPAEPEPFLIDGIMPMRGNIILTAQYKSGKTDLLMGSLARSLADAEPFLDHFQVFTPDGGLKVGHWNLEMDEGFLIDQYIRPSSYVNTDNLMIASLQGYRVSVLSEVGRAWTVTWLKDNEIKVWTIDSIAQLARMAGVSENSNEEMSQLFGAISEIKTEAGVDVCVLIAHTGRAQQEEGKEHARAATVIDDWPDFRWVMTVDNSDVRWLQVQGRGKPLKPSSLAYDPDSHRYTFIGDTKQTAAAFGGAQMVATALQSMNGQGLNKTSLVKKLREMKPGLGQSTASSYIEEALVADLIEIREEHGRAGVSKVHYLTSDSAPEGDRQRMATPRLIDGTDVREPKKRRRG